MAFVQTPTTMIASWSSDGTNVTFPIASVSELSSAEASASTGDSRKIMFAFCEKFFNYYNNLATADKPNKVAATKSSSIQSDGTYQNTYQFTFKVGVTAQEVVAES